MRSLHVALAALVALPALAAAQSGVLPPRWKARLDRANLPTDYRLVAVPNAMQMTTVRAAGIFYDPRTTASAPFRAEATLTQLKAPAHPEAFGIFVGGAGLDTPAQRYLYFLVRGDGKYLVKQRVGDDVRTIADWTSHPAVRSADAAGRATNALRVDVGLDSMRFSVNGTRLLALATPVALRGEGIVGLRVNHALDLRIDGPRVTALR